MSDLPKQPLYRKVNTLARLVRHRFGVNASSTRAKDSKSDVLRISKSAKTKRGLDYTPLFRFLLSKVGSDWDSVYSEAKARLDKSDPIFWMVALHDFQKRPYFVTSEATYYNGLYVDECGTLQLVDATVNASSLKPYCKCCTHTFNGQVFLQKFTSLEESLKA